MAKGKKARALPEVPTEQLSLPAALAADGTFLTLGEIASGRFALDFPQLPPEQKARLTAERIRRQPRYVLAMVGAGLVDQERAIREVESLTDVGRQLIEIEERTINYLRQHLPVKAGAVARKAAAAKTATQEAKVSIATPPGAKSTS